VCRPNDEQSALAAAAEGPQPIALQHFKWAKKPEFHVR
jgi:hypothetical protein